MKKTIKILLYSVLILSLFYFIIPDEKIGRIVWKYRVFIDDPVVLCVEYYRNDFSDPDSVKPIESSINEGVTYFSMYVSAKNKFGGGVKEKLYCLNDGRSYSDSDDLQQLKKDSALSRITDEIKKETLRLKQGNDDWLRKKGGF